MACAAAALRMTRFRASMSERYLRSNPPSLCLSPHQLALASWHLLLPHPQAGADGEKGPLNYPQRKL